MASDKMLCPECGAVVFLNYVDVLMEGGGPREPAACERCGWSETTDLDDFVAAYEKEHPV